MAGKNPNYSTWEEFFMGEALLSSTRSKDPSTQVGACIVDNNNVVVSQGYNGLTRGMDDNTFPWDSPGEKTGDLRTTKNPYVVHAELNAILQSHGKDLEGTTIYVTLFPCNECAKAIIQSGIKKVIYLREYKHQDLVEITKMMFDAAGVEYCKYNEELDLTKEDVIETTNGIKQMIKRYSIKQN